MHPKKSCSTNKSIYIENHFFTVPHNDLFEFEKHYNITLTNIVLIGATANYFLKFVNYFRFLTFTKNFTL